MIGFKQPVGHKGTSQDKYSLGVGVGEVDIIPEMQNCKFQSDNQIFLKSVSLDFSIGLHHIVPELSVPTPRAQQRHFLIRKCHFLLHSHSS